MFTLGDAMVDMVVSLPELPRRGGDVEIGHYSKLPGGSAANVAVGLSRLGVKTAFLGAVGGDQEGVFLLNEFAKEGVDVSGVRVACDVPTGLVISLADETGERTMLSFRGAGTEFRLEDTDLERVLRGKVLHVSGYCFIRDPQRGASLALVRACKEKGVRVSFDPGPQVSRVAPVVLDEVLQCTTIFLPNRLEAFELTGKSEPEEAARAALGLGPKLTCIKLGGAGCVIAEPSRCLRIAGFSVRVVDSTGAGDAFDAGFLYAFLRGWGLEEMGRFANAVGALSTAQTGARASLPRLNEVGLFLKEMESGDGAVSKRFRGQ
ncbi:MAG: carbohydrate kinase family protein [Bacillota bacterium]